MNEETPVPRSTPPPAPERAVPALARPIDWGHWARQFLLCNPFYLCSAALLLFGVNRLANDEKLFPVELHNLLFNFSALQFYEVLVVLTALVLARRRVWYDSALLVVLEHGLILVPFVFLSQAVVQGEAAGDGLRLAVWLSLAGGAAAAGRLAATRRWYPQFNLPPRALWLGAVVLAGNVALPLLFRPRMEQDVADWREENLVLWLVVLPLLAAGANLLPRPGRCGTLAPQRPWLPLLIHGLWVTGTAVHVWGVAHICSLPLEAFHLAPLAWVAAWTLWRRCADCTPVPSLRLQQALLGLAMAAPVLALAESRLFLALTGANLLACGMLLLRHPAPWPLRETVKHLALASLAMMVAGFPVESGRLVLPDFNRPRGLLAGCALFTVLQALRSPHPLAGVAGAVAAGLSLAGFVNPVASPFGVHLIVQGLLVFLLLHSLRWREDAHPGAGLVRWLAVAGWVADTWVWTSALEWPAVLGTGGAGLVVGAAWLAAWWRHGLPGSPAIPLGALAALGAAPGHWLLRHGSDGVLALLGSLALFAAGTAVAWTRQRWDRRHRPEGG